MRLTATVGKPTPSPTPNAILSDRDNPDPDFEDIGAAGAALGCDGPLLVALPLGFARSTSIDEPERVDAEAEGRENVARGVDVADAGRDVEVKGLKNESVPGV